MRLSPLVLILVLGLPVLIQSSELDGFEAEEASPQTDESWDGFGHATRPPSAGNPPATVEDPAEHLQPPASAPAGEGAPLSQADEEPGRAAAAGQRGHPRAVPAGPKSYVFEAAMVAFLAAYIVNFFLGKRKNEAVALEWANAFCSEGAVMERNFSLLGPGDTEEGEIMMKDSHSIFKFYASGRRFCKGMLAALDLKRRQDLLSYLIQPVMPKDDTLTVEVFMNESTMPPVVFAVGNPRDTKELFKTRADLQSYAKLVNLRDRIPAIAADRIACYAESKEVAGDIIASSLDDVITEAAWDTAGRFLQSVLVSSEASRNSHSKIILFVFRLPPPGSISELGPALAAIPSVIDAVGSYKMSAEARKRAEERRRKVAPSPLPFSPCPRLLASFSLAAGAWRSGKGHPGMEPCGVPRLGGWTFGA